MTKKAESKPKKKNKMYASSGENVAFFFTKPSDLMFDYTRKGLLRGNKKPEFTKLIRGFDQYKTTIPQHTLLLTPTGSAKNFNAVFAM